VRALGGVPVNIDVDIRMPASGTPSTWHPRSNTAGLTYPIVEWRREVVIEHLDVEQLHLGLARARVADDPNRRVLQSESTIPRFLVTVAYGDIELSLPKSPVRGDSFEILIGCQITSIR
jgi:hypothetical protein